MMDVGYDAELRRHNEVLHRVVGVRHRDHVLDIGCGAGSTTRQAARSAPAGQALGVDVSSSSIELAREMAHAEGLGNVSFEQADAQVHQFSPESFDLAISRFGTMFLDDPVAGFTNVCRALRPGGRLVMMVWQAAERNEWDIVLHRTLGAAEGAPDCAPEGPDPFSLADPTIVTGILQTAGFAKITFADVHEPVYYGPDVDAALSWIRCFTSTRDALSRLDPAAATRALERLRRQVEVRLRDDGVWFDSRAWIVTAHRASVEGTA